MFAGCEGHFPVTEVPVAQLQVHVPPAEEQADSWMTPPPVKLINSIGINVIEYIFIIYEIFLRCNKYHSSFIIYHLLILQSLIVGHKNKYVI